MRHARCLSRGPSRAAAQRGISLIIVMLVLIVVTIVGIGGAQLALLSERSTRYDRDYLVASQAAEAALKDAEADIAGLPVAGSVTLTPTTRSASFAPGNNGIFVNGCGTTSVNRGLCVPPDDDAKPIWAIVDFLDNSNSAPTVEIGDYTGALRKSAFQENVGIAPERKPRYIIELIDDKDKGNNAAGPQKKMYRITAIGFGPRKEVQVVLQTAYRKAST